MKIAILPECVDFATDTCDAFLTRLEVDFDVDFTDIADLVFDVTDLDNDVADFATDVADFVTDVADFAIDVADFATDVADFATDVADFATEATDFADITDDFDKTGSSDGDGCSTEVFERFDVFDFDADNFDEVDFIDVTDFASGLEVKDRFVTDITDGTAVADAA